jgi:hypothetical protein
MKAFAIALTLCVVAQAQAQSFSVVDGVAAIDINAQNQIQYELTNYGGDKTAVTKILVTGTGSLSNNDFTAINTLTGLQEVDFSGFTTTTFAIPNAQFQNKPITKFSFPSATSITIGRYAFQGTRLSGIINIPKSAAKTGNFNNTQYSLCPLITGFNIEADDANEVKSVDGIVFSADGTSLWQYPAGKTDAAYIVPNGVTVFGGGAFTSVVYLKDLTMPTGSAEWVADRYIAAIFTSGMLENIHVDAGNTFYFSHNGQLAKKSNNALLFCPYGKKYVRIEAPVTSIANSYLENYQALKSVTFGSALSTGSAVFRSCEHLEQIIIETSGVVLGSNNGTATFTVLPNFRIGVPANLVSTYKAAANWSEFAAYIQPLYDVNYTDASSPQGAKGVLGNYPVPVVADAVDGKVFTHWSSTNSNVVFAGANSPSTSFTLSVDPAGAPVDITANYSEGQASSYSITINGSGTADKQTAYTGETVTVTATGVAPGNPFIEWTSNLGVTFENETAPVTSFIMPAGDITVNAVYVLPARTVTVTASQRIADLLSLNERASLPALSVLTSETVLDAADFTTLNAMGKLENLDLSGDVNTVSIPNNALQNNKTIKHIDFPVNLTGFGGGVLNGSALEGTVTLPGTINGGGNFVSRLDNMQGVTAFAFTGNSYFTTPDGVVIYGGNSFYKYPCGKTDEVYTLPDGITFIAQQAFGDNNKLKKLVLPASLASFQAEGAIFRNSGGIVSSMEEIEVDAANTTYVSMDGIFANKSTKTLVYLPGAYKKDTVTIDGSLVETVPAMNTAENTNGFFMKAVNLKKITFTEGVKTIGNNAFKSLANLETVYLPSTLTSIGNESFRSIPVIKTVVCRAATPPTYGSNAFNEAGNGNDPKYIYDVFVPENSVGDYQTVWTGVSSQNIKAYYNITAISATATSPLASDIAAAGQTVSIAADPAPSGQVFNKWEAVGITLEDDTEETASFTMPAGDVSLTATYKDAAPTSLASAEAAGEALLPYPNPAVEWIRIGVSGAVPYAIYNTLGSIVAQGVSNGQSIAVASLPPGIYTLKAAGRAARFIKK